MNETESEPNPTDWDTTSALAMRLCGAAPLSVLRPAAPPGRRSRKARAYSEQIQRLASEGYSLELIREALAEAGIVVSKSTVQREAARRRRPAPGLASPSSMPRLGPAALAAAPTAESQVPEPASAPIPLRGKDVAEAFMNGRITNPLLQRGKP